ncbi:hypothetical protein [Synechococcus sp. HK01-R]|uniref:hypothetical protein n=1 Tax=Synechococcus sp. HK01-R TaxID=2751171 RepID=UPI0016299399|nr:hypothetical protein [Synechococcus sp. HK01-R]QNG27770.1 hypothetical protein H0O21_04065 [Synechococcus sp. HK01-R]
MALSSDLIATARQLAHVHQRRPRQADLRRSISTAYDAVFHGLAEVTAIRLVGTSGAAQKTPAWSRVYRALNHQTIKKACGLKEAQNYSQDLAVFIDLFPSLQERRHQDVQTVPRDEQLDFIALGMSRRSLG